MEISEPLQLHCLVLGFEKLNQHLFYYVAHKAYFFEELQKEKFSPAVAYCECWVLLGECVNIISMEVQPTHQHQGLASLIIYKLKHIASKTGIRLLCVDDLSSRSHQLAGNLYVQHGFRHKDRKCGPEMVLYL